MGRRLRSGYTTGACAAAAAKAAALLLLKKEKATSIEIPFPDGSRHRFDIYEAALKKKGMGLASVLKDAGDDPDVTNGAEIAATVQFLEEGEDLSRGVSLVEGKIYLCAGVGVGMVSKPGLAVSVGEPAINPVPRQMIAEAVQEVLGDEEKKPLLVIISVPRGEELAKKTLNQRLGIMGGLSILGTTGIVRPVSADAWTATINASLDVAKAAGLTEVVLSTGRTSEKAVQRILQLPDEAYAMMGDYLSFSLKEAAARGFKKIHLAGMWAKIMKGAMKIPQTHVRHGALEVADGAALLAQLGAGLKLAEILGASNTAREMYGHLMGADRPDLVKAVCQKAKDYAEKEAGIPVEVYLVNSNTQVVEHV